MPPARPATEGHAAAGTPREKLNTKAAGIVGLAVLCSRILGLAREQIFAALFGGGRLMDAFTIAFRIPNLLRDLFAEGALSTSFITTFSKTIATDGDGAAWRLAEQGRHPDRDRAELHHHRRHHHGSLAGARPRARLRWRQGGADHHADPDHVSLHPAGVAGGAGDGHAERQEVFGVPAMASSFFNLGSIVSGVALGYWLDPQFRPAGAAGFRHRHAHRRIAAVWRAVAGAAAASATCSARTSNGATKA